MKEQNPKKIVLACLVIMILMIVYTKVKTGTENKTQEIEAEAIIGGADGPTSLLLTDRLYETGETQNGSAPSNTENSADSSQEEDSILGPAEKINLEKARKESYGLVAELDYVGEKRISLHGTFGYMAFSLESSADGIVEASLENAVTFEELGGINMGGAAYTDILGGDGCALVIPGIHNQEIARRRKFLYIEETNEIQGGIVAPQWMMEKVNNGDYTDTVTVEELVPELTKELRENEGSKLLYGPVIVPESNSNLYGFLAAGGEKLEDIWYGLWNEDLETVTKIPLF